MKYPPPSPAAVADDDDDMKHPPPVNNDKHAFNGGKMEHIFEIEKQGNKNRYTSVYSCPDAQQALEQGRMYWKIDGACGMIQWNRDTDQIEVYERFDTRGKEPPPDVIALMPGRNADKYARHSYFMRQVVLQENNGKKLAKIKTALLDILETHHDKLVQAIGKHGQDDCLSVEFVGQKYQKTPGVEHMVALVLHCRQVVQVEPLPRTFVQVQEFLAQYIVEGIVVEYQGRFWKIRSNLMNPGCLFETNRDQTMPPVDVFHV